MERLKAAEDATCATAAAKQHSLSAPASPRGSRRKRMPSRSTSRVAPVMDDLMALGLGADEAEVDALQEQLRASQRDREQLRRENEALSSELLVVRASLASCQRVHQDNHFQLQNYARQLSMIARALEQRTASHTEVQSENAALQQRCAKLVQEKSLVRMELDAALDERFRLRRDLAREREDAVSQSRRQEDVLAAERARNRALCDENEQLQRKLLELSEKNRALQGTLEARHEAELRAVSEERDSLLKEVRMLRTLQEEQGKRGIEAESAEALRLQLEHDRRAHESEMEGALRALAEKEESNSALAQQLETLKAHLSLHSQLVSMTPVMGLPAFTVP